MKHADTMPQEMKLLAAELQGILQGSMHNTLNYETHLKDVIASPLGGAAAISTSEIEIAEFIPSLSRDLLAMTN